MEPVGSKLGAFEEAEMVVDRKPARLRKPLQGHADRDWGFAENVFDFGVSPISLQNQKGTSQSESKAQTFTCRVGCLGELFLCVCSCDQRSSAPGHQAGHGGDPQSFSRHVPLTLWNDKFSNSLLPSWFNIPNPAYGIVSKWGAPSLAFWTIKRNAWGTHRHPFFETPPYSITMDKVRPLISKIKKPLPFRTIQTQCIQTYSFQSCTWLILNSMDSDIFVSIKYMLNSKPCIVNQPDSSYKITRLIKESQPDSNFTFQGLLWWDWSDSQSGAGRMDSKKIVLVEWLGWEAIRCSSFARGGWEDRGRPRGRAWECEFRCPQG